MNIQLSKSNRGSVLLISLVTATIILTSLAAYLIMISNERQSVTRSQAWNSCVPVMEAGVEEAMTQIHQCGYSNLGTNSWTLGSDGMYHKTRQVGTNGDYCMVSIVPANPPVIYSEAFVVGPYYNSSNNYVKREVRVDTKSPGATGGGLVAKGSITLAGGSTFDSYNSAVGYTPGVHGTNAIAITDTNSPGAINLVGTSAIYGTAITGPGGSVSASGTAAVGDASWVASSTGVEAGWSSTDANVQFNDISAPYTTGTSISTGTYGGTNYTYLLNSAVSSQYYYSGNLSLVSSQVIMVVGNVTLYITGGLSLLSHSYIAIAPGSSLKLYLGGPCQLDGGGVVNMSGIPANFSLYGLPTCTSITYGGGASFQGTVNAPEASFSFGANSVAFGAFTAHDISVGGGASVHYDTALGAAKVFLVADWNEIAP